MFEILSDIARARREKGLTQGDLGRRVKVDRQAITRLEQGVGSLVLLHRVMAALDYHLVGFAGGSTLSEQIGNRRKALRLAKAEVARRAGVSRATVAAIEAGTGSISSLIEVLAVLGTKRMGRRKPQLIPLAPLNAAERDKRFTPQHFLDTIALVWGDIDLDPCAHIESPVRARRRILLQEGGDGLRDDWAGRVVYLNPPFSRAFTWLQRADEMWTAGKVEVVIALLPARTDGTYFHDRLAKICDIGFLRGRLQFSRGEGQQDLATRAPFPSMVVIWGASNEEIEHFAQLCPTVWLERSPDLETRSVRSK